MVILCAALAGMIIGFLGTIVTFWCCGFFERNSPTVSSTRLNPELENALIKAGYGQPSASEEASSSIEMRRTQTVSVIDPLVNAFRMHVGDVGTVYTMSTVIVKAILTMSGGSCQCERFAGIHLCLLRSGGRYMFLNVVRDFICPDIAVLSRIAQ